MRGNRLEESLLTVRSLTPMHDLVVKNPGVVEAPPLVAASTAENCDLDSHCSADATRALFPGAVSQQLVVLFVEVVVLAPSFQKGSVFIDRADQFCMRFTGSVGRSESCEPLLFHRSAVVVVGVSLPSRFSPSLRGVSVGAA